LNALVHNFSSALPVGLTVALLPDIELQIAKSASLLRKTLQIKQGLAAEEVRNVEIALSALTTKKRDECADLLLLGLRHFLILGAASEWVDYLSAEFLGETVTPSGLKSRPLSRP
jgi:hypothetical protein